MLAAAPNMEDKQLQAAPYASPVSMVAGESNASPAEKMLALAVEKNLSIEMIERLMTLYREELTRRQKQEYDAAKAKLQAEMPVIEKNKVSKYKSGVIMYTYADIDNVIGQTKEAVGRNGFSYDFEEQMNGDKMKVTCVVTHEGGYTKRFDMESGLATRTDIMSAPQQVAATMTFLKRHTYMNAFGITTADADVDAEGDDRGGKPTDEQLKKIDNLIEQSKLDREYVEKRCFEKYGVKFSAINTVQADGIITSLEKKISEGANV